MKNEKTNIVKDDKTASSRVFRGGNWYCHPFALRSARRGGISPTYRYYSVGFRLVLQKKKK
jgi:formylglycine-generating enzyme required for sulfatase activity